MSIVGVIQKKNYIKKILICFTYICRYLDFVAMSLCGLQEKGDPSDEEFERHSIKYKDVSFIRLRGVNNILL